MSSGQEPIHDPIDLPPEMLSMISSHLTKKELLICVRVCKTWYEGMIGPIWHTLQFQDYMGQRASLRFQAIYRPPPSSPPPPPPLPEIVVALDSANRSQPQTFSRYYSETERRRQEAAKNADLTASILPVSLARNLSRIRVLSVSQFSLLDLLLQASAMTTRTPDHGQDKDTISPRPRISAPTVSPLQLEELKITFPTTKDIPILCEFLHQAEATLARVEIQIHDGNAQREDCARILASLPRNIEKLSLVDWHSGLGYYKDIEKDIAQRHTRPSNDLESLLVVHHPLALKFEKLTTLSINSRVVDVGLWDFFFDRCPNLQELDYDNCNTCERLLPWDDIGLAYLISKGSPKGWKTLGFHEMTRTIGTLTVKAILEHAATLENLRISGCAAFDSQAIQTLLCTAPRLKRFDTIATGVLSDVDSCVLLANDIIGVLPISSTSNLGWVCLELESFKCKIAGIPRPDIQAKKNGRPLTDSEYHDPSRYNQRQSRWIQQRVLGQLGRLTKLREITLGQDIMVSSCEVMMEDEIREDDYYDEENLEIGHQYQCLTMTLEDGLDQLSGLKNLRRLCIEKISHGQKEAEKQWMKEHWPVFGKPTKDMFWSSRGHDVNADWIGPDDRDRYGGNLWDWW